MRSTLALSLFLFACGGTNPPTLGQPDMVETRGASIDGGATDLLPTSAADMTPVKETADMTPAQSPDMTRMCGGVQHACTSNADCCNADGYGACNVGSQLGQVCRSYAGGECNNGFDCFDDGVNVMKCTNRVCTP